MRSLLILLSVIYALTLCPFARAEQKVVYVENRLGNTPDLRDVQRLLNMKWHITLISAACDSTDSTITTFFVLESPPAQPAAPDSKAVWRAVYNHHKATYSSLLNNEENARAFADQVVAAVVGAASEVKP